MDVLSCSYDLRFPIFHSPVEVLDPGVFPQSCLSRLCWISDPTGSVLLASPPGLLYLAD